MDFPRLHDWDLNCRQAAELQRELAGRVSLASGLPPEVRRVAGADVSYRMHGEEFFAAVVVLSLPGLEVVEEVHACGRTTFPYVPGLLSFRELPVTLEAFRRLKTRPDAVLVDGQGIAHPRRLGLASHLGLWLGLPTVGCAKSRLCGEHRDPGLAKGERAPPDPGRGACGVRAAHPGRGSSPVRFSRPPDRSGRRRRTDPRLHNPLPHARADPPGPPADQPPAPCRRTESGELRAAQPLSMVLRISKISFPVASSRVPFRFANSTVLRPMTL